MGPGCGPADFWRVARARIPSGWWITRADLSWHAQRRRHTACPSSRPSVLY
ncbi:MAG: hypothetical protein OXG81_06975 [Acidobacteria bacterium]|nr:hypothetical protein [Acidobacteriota bacterium]